MSWRDGCRPPPPEGVEGFDVALADEVGERLDRLRRAVVADREARAAAAALLGGWTGAHRATFDARDRALDRALAAADLAVELARLRAAWDEAVR